MHVFGMIIFLAVWLLILWIGSIALEATGLERSRARFQALNALSGVGFTTSQSELVVEHTARRRIVSYLIFIGNTGVITLLLLVVIYARAGIELPSITTIVIAVAILFAIGLSIWLGLINKITSVILGLIGKQRSIVQKIVYQAGDYAAARLSLGKQASMAGLTIKDAGFQQQGISVLAIERRDTVVPQPQPDEKLLAGDSLLCYGRLATINDICNN